MSVVSAQSPVALPAVRAGRFQYGSPPPGVSGGGQKVLLVPVTQFVRSVGAPRQEVVSVDGRRYLRLTDEGHTRLVPLVTGQGAPVLDPGSTDSGGRAGSGGSSADGQQAAAPAEKRPRPPSDDAAEPAAGRPQSPALFEEEESRPPLQTVIYSSGEGGGRNGQLAAWSRERR